MWRGSGESDVCLLSSDFSVCPEKNISGTKKEGELRYNGSFSLLFVFGWFAASVVGQV